MDFGPRDLEQRLANVCVAIEPALRLATGVPVRVLTSEVTAEWAAIHGRAHEGP